MKYAVIFGSSSGLAKASIKHLLNDGYTVIGFDIVNKNETKDNLYLRYCDVLDDNSILEAKNFVETLTSKVDVITNFVGIVKLGSLVELDLNALNQIFQLNLNSTYKINNIFYNLVKNAEGKIVNISSEYGKITAIPWHSYYSITKYGMEVYSDSLRRELANSKIKVIKIRPGAFKTNMQGGVTKSFDKLFNETKLYKNELMKLKFMMDDELKKAKDPDIFGRKFLKIVNSKHPKKVYNIKNSFKMKLLTMLPSSLQDFLFKIILK